MNCISKLMELIYSIRCYFQKISKLRENIETHKRFELTSRAMFGAFILFEIFYIPTRILYFSYIMCFFLMLFLIIEYINILLDALNSFRKTMKLAFVNWVVAALAAYFIQYLLKLNLKSTLMVWGIILIIYFFLWLGLCLVIDFDISKLVNQIFSIILTIITTIANFVFLLISSKVSLFVLPKSITYLKQYGYSANQIAQVGINVFFVPLILIELLTQACVSIYQYWENKYKSKE